MTYLSLGAGMARSQSLTEISQAPPAAEPLIPVKQIVVTGGTIFPEARLSELTTPLLNKSVTLKQLREVADKITQLYQDGNYITSRAILPADQPDINAGIVKIQILEGSLERIEIKRSGDGGGRLSENYIRDRIALGTASPLNFSRLEDELHLLRTNPLIGDIRASLAAGSGPGLSVLQVTYSEATSLSAGSLVDNYGNPATGIYRFGVSAQELNLTGNGDRLSGSYIRSGSADSISANYQFPLGARGATLDFNFSTGQNPITEAPFNTLNIRTDSQVFEVLYRHPLLRNPREEFALSFGTAIESSNSTLDGRSFNFQTLQPDDGRSQSTVLRFGQDLISRDAAGAWAFRSVFNVGINALGATIRESSPDGRFFTWVGQALRVQRLGQDRDTLAFFRLGMQFSGNNLLPLNRYSIGGPQSVRGYRQNLITGDSGIQGTVELQFPVMRDGDGTSLVKLLPFFDLGTVWNNSGSNPSPQTLAGIGLGVLWQPSRNFTLRLDYGVPLNKVTTTNSNLQDSGLYFSLNANL